MWPFKAKEETRDAEDTEQTAAAGEPEGWAEFLAALRGTAVVDREIAMNIPAVAGAVQFISEQAAAVPFLLYKNTKNGTEEMKNDPRVRMFNQDTGDAMNGTEAKAAMVRDYLLQGAGYSYIEADGNDWASLHYIARKDIAVQIEPDPIYKSATYTINGAMYEDYHFLKLCRHSENGLTGKGITEENAKMLALAWATIVLQNTMMNGGGNKRGYLMADHKMSQPALDKLKEAFEKMYSASASGVIVLNKGVDFKEASNTAVEMQMQETVQENRLDLCSMLCLPPEVLTGKATEEQFTNAIRQAVMPVINAMEAMLNRDALLEREKGKRVWRADTTQLNKGAIKARYEAYKVACEAGWMGKNEVRKQEQLPQIDGLDVVSMNLGEVLFDMKTGKYFTPNTAKITDIGQDAGAPAAELQQGAAALQQDAAGQTEENPMQGDSPADAATPDPEPEETEPEETEPKGTEPDEDEKK